MFEQAKQNFVDGIAHFEAQRLDQAERCFLASLALLPGRASTIANLAATQLRLGRPEEALAHIEQLLGIDANDLEAVLQRCAARIALDRHAEALIDAQRVTVAQPQRIEAWTFQATALAALERHRDALRAFERLTQLQPDAASAWVAHGQALQRLDRVDEALHSFERALALDPDIAFAWSQRGCLLKDLGRRDEAIASFRRAIECGGDAHLNRYFLSALQADAMPETAPRAYVESLFDNYAGSFDQHLLNQLGYDVHIELSRAVAAGSTGRRASVLDLGCGTGLCGPLVRPLTRRLVGVDLSQRMLERARVRGVYDALVHADGVEHLQTTEERHDVLLAADVFIYVGRLEAVFDGARRVLSAGGLFCFSVERADDDCDVRLTEGLRYAHSQRHVRELAARYGFECVSLARHTLREDQRQPIEGLLVSLRNGGAVA